MKRKIILFSLLFAVMLSCLLPIAVSAEEEILPEQTDVPDASAPAAEEDNLFAVLYEKISGSFGSILAGIAAAASLLIVFTYKKGLLPLLSGALERLTGTVKNVGADAEKQAGLAKELAENLSERLHNAERTLERFSILLKDYEDKLPTVEAQQGESAVFRTVLLGQIDLLENVFMASSLPQYRKDEIGERVRAMKAAVRSEVTEVGEAKD